MRGSQLVTSYIQAVIFVALGIRCIMTWRQSRDRRSGHLALAAGLFGLSSAMSAVTSTFIETAKGEVAPRWEAILAGIVIYLSVYFFLLFLSDFVAFPKWVHGLLILATLASIVLAIIERPDVFYDANFQKQPIPGVNNPIPYLSYIGWVIVYLAVAFGVLALAFLVYGFRSSGLARFRMLCIGAGFFLLFVAIGLIPRILYGDPTAETVKTVGNAVRYIALGCGPLLYLGFAPPSFVRKRFPETSETQAAG